ncbi:inactive ubiquitin carboxyl-terminal hydrolase MINDY-4B-like isoform X2 [Planococcus citri]
MGMIRHPQPATHTTSKTDDDGKLRKFEDVAKCVVQNVKTSYMIKDRIMYARSQQRPHRPPICGGQPITPEIATALRVLVFGGCATPPRGEWLRTGLVFRESEKDLAYGLRAPRNGTRGLLSALQAYILKYLLFERKNERKLSADELLKPNKCDQTDALWKALSDILWKIGEKKKAVIALPQEKAYVPHSIAYFQDSVTEKLHIFEISEEEELQIFLKRYIYIFQDEPGPGSLLLLYSAVLTRGIKKVKSDFIDEKQHLVMSSEEGSQCIVMLLLTGRASSFLHNGVVYVGDEDHYAKAHFGVLTRSEIGFLFYEEDMGERAPGSRLKTPSLPIWVVYCLGHFGVIFNTNKELLRNYHAERRFELIYYTCGGSRCQLIVDTRSNSLGSSKLDENAPTMMVNLEKLIHTKWEDAHIEWNGSTNVI